MPLSEHEQRILDEIERRLAAEDPKFARSATLVTPRGVAIRRVKRGAWTFLLGFSLLLAGLFTGDSLLLPLGLAGFAVMLVATVAVAKASKAIGRAPSAPRNPTWFKRAEERWRERFERGDER